MIILLAVLSVFVFSVAFLLGKMNHVIIDENGFIEEHF